MKTGIIVHSKTGNTYSVAQRLQESLLKLGYSVSIEQIIPADENQLDVNKVQLNKVPDINEYDVLVFAGPVHGFSLSPALAACLSKYESLKDRKIAIMVTQAFPFPFLGGNRTIAKIKQICELKGAIICDTGIVNWSSRRRKEMIEEVAERLSKCFG